MPTYISLLRYTQQGVQNIKESPARLDAAKKAFKAMGGELKQESVKHMRICCRHECNRMSGHDLAWLSSFV